MGRSEGDSPDQPQFIPMADTNTMSRSHSTLSLGGLLAWMVYCAAYLSVLGSAAELFDREGPSASRCCLLVGCWVLLLWYYVRRRYWGALILHLFVAVQLPVTLALPGVVEQHLTRTVAATMCFASLLSFPISLVKLFEEAFRHDAPPMVYLAYNVVGTTTLFCLLCTIFPSISLRAVHWPSATFGALIGLWGGLYLAVGNSPQLRCARIGGIPVRPAVAAGLWVGLAGSVVLWLLNQFVFTFPLVPVTFAPLILGIFGAVAVGFALRQNRSMEAL